jgi:hypothetical protein
MIEPTPERLLAAGAALEDLEPAEAAAWTEHRSGCAECRSLEGDLGTVLADLALAVPERIPPPDLLDAVRRSIGRVEAGSLLAPASTGDTASPGTVPVSLDEARARRETRRRPDGVRLALLGIAAAFSLAAVGLGARSVALQRDVERAGAQAAGLQAKVAGQDAVMATALDPGHVAVTLQAQALAPSATAQVMYLPGTSRAYVVADHLPATPSGRGYQLWYADAAGVHPLQTVSFDGNGAFVAPLDVDLSTAAAVMITLEAAGGATGEPGPQVVFGEL